MSKINEVRLGFETAYIDGSVASSGMFCLDPDDGLTMNLGVNPLLQYGLQNTREALINNILNAISVARYVPFDSTTIGNPALDPMDVVKFSGGHAD